MGYYPEQQRPSFFRRIAGVIALMAILVVTALVILLSYVTNTIFLHSLGTTPNFASLPAAARSAFGSVVSYTLTTYGFIIVVVIVLAVTGTVAAVFALQSQPGDAGDEW